ncbi:hypothetical protein TC41_3108 [Alicyclobacillus acidocaldarius subsp. acidocaldarius Tc-4-1]|uniref:Uncharacterized protein n=1 Tax=Alicyclobacillus acidocaldarius (strain Tc-4-1) TaxID=1048834 RepID=F8ICY6_ALIAT|nr:hypothetical protein TC41_3108 [Alicyclobacillus acidocaldarius subsp. acidocaldarius Tc-4-1]
MHAPVLYGFLNSPKRRIRLSWGCETHRCRNFQHHSPQGPPSAMHPNPTLVVVYGYISSLGNSLSPPSWRGQAAHIDGEV